MPSRLWAIFGLVWAVFFGFAWFVFDALEGVAGGRNTSDWGWMMWGIFGPQVILGISLLAGGRFMPALLRSVFILATLATLGQGISVAELINGGRDHVPFMVISALVALIPQSIGWRSRATRNAGRTDV